jgi:RNA polymerase sigma factor (sigma-70 family)
VSRGAVDDLLAEVARTRGSALLAYACMLTGDRAAGQDLVQDAFLKVFGRVRLGFAPDLAEAYLRRTILTLYIDGFRRRRHWQSVQHLFAARDDTVPETPVAERMDLHAALASLSPRQRAVVVLRFYEDLTVPEVAEQLELSPGTVKRYLHDATQVLEARLGPLTAPHDDVAPVGTRPTSTARRG